MTVAALIGGASLWATIGAVVVDAAVIAGTALSITSSYQQADAAADSARAQAQAQKQLYEAQAEMYAQQAAENERLAEVENAKAGIAQVQGEQEAEARSRALASEIGSLYAGYAGNGLLVDGGEDDTFANVLKSSVGEAQQDISTINDNTAISVWDHQMNRRAYLANAAIYSTASSNSYVSAANALMVGESQAAAAKAGLTTNAVGKSLTAAGTLAGMGISSYSTLASTGSGFNAAKSYDWNGSTFASTMA